jgi:glutamine synthetase type III
MSKIIELYEIFREKIGETEARVLYEVLEEIAGRRENLATKDDVAGLSENIRGEMSSLREEMRDEISLLREEVNREISSLREEMRGEISSLREEVNREISSLREEVYREISALRREVREDIQSLRQELEILKREVNRRFWWIVWLIMVQWLSVMMSILLKG